jgi:CRISPR/Cas system-associated protein Cas10 (large subunit of type III CRISPR-Cas system)
MARGFLRDFLGPECVLFAAGGSLLAIAPPTMAEEALEGVKKRFEDGTGGRVTITTSCVVKDGGEFQDNFGSVWEASQAQMRMEKSRRMLVPRFYVDEGVDVCDVCRKNPWSREFSLRPLTIDTSTRFERLCHACWDLREKGKGVWLDDLRDKRNFVGCVRIDGDDVGRVLAGKVFAEQNKAATPSRISTISRLMHRVCEEDFKAVIHDFAGRSSIVFAGGDDLLAFVQGDNALEAARKIALRFNEVMARACTVSAGVSIFHYKLPVYVGLESANSLLRKAKDEGKNRVAFAVVGSSGAAEVDFQRVKSRSWEELGALLDVVNFMRQSSLAVSQLRRIAGVSASNPDKAEAIIKYLMAREIISWDGGIKMLSNLKSGLLADAFLVYNLSKGD